MFSANSVLRIFAGNYVCPEITSFPSVPKANECFCQEAAPIADFLCSSRGLFHSAVIESVWKVSVRFRSMTRSTWLLKYVGLALGLSSKWIQRSLSFHLILFICCWADPRSIPYILYGPLSSMPGMIPESRNRSNHWVQMGMVQKQTKRCSHQHWERMVLEHFMTDTQQSTTFKLSWLFNKKHTKIIK